MWMCLCLCRCLRICVLPWDCVWEWLPHRRQWALKQPRSSQMRAATSSHSMVMLSCAGASMLRRLGRSAGHLHVTPACHISFNGLLVCRGSHWLNQWCGGHTGRHSWPADGAPQEHPWSNARRSLLPGESSLTITCTPMSTSANLAAIQ